ncbi:MAG TPA: FUSC family protein [Candidatus Dormibacteraeota bacterium]|jgi:uncharacterized membrane protein YccC|nr:FUSC family protein [Candidatus Dormibacteraeota bacterium]
MSRERSDPVAKRWRESGRAVVDAAGLAAACLVTYLLITDIVVRINPFLDSNGLLGGMWAVVATIFVYRDTYQQSVVAALSRMAATSVSFILCLVYLAVLPVTPWGLAVLIGTGALLVTLAGRPGDAITTGITTTVVMVVAALAPHDRWEQPILRCIDTVVGIAVGVLAAWITVRLTRTRVAGRRSEPDRGS